MSSKNENLSENITHRTPKFSNEFYIGSVECSLDLNKYLIKHPAATFFVRVHGVSMQDEGIFSGDLLIVDRAIEAKSGHIVLAVIDGEFTVKRLLKKKHAITFAPTHPSWEITQETEVQIWGVVTYVIHQTK